MDRSYRTRMSALLGGLLLAISQAGNAITIAETPLFIALGTSANVMLVVDNSGSMESIVWADGYDPRVIYPDWSPMVLDSGGNCSKGTSYSEGWDYLDSSITPSTFTNANYRGTCAGKTPPNPVTCPTSGTTRGVSPNGLITKCLKLPDPLGGGTRYAGNYLNFLFANYGVAAPTITDLSTGVLIPNDYRMNVAKKVATALVTNNTNVRMGLMAFNTTQGGKILQACNTGNTAALNTSIAGLSASTWTPLAEALYELTRYFRGMTGYYNSGTYTSPIQYRCQKNFAIVITDGYPTQDTDFPTNDPADVLNTSRALPNWDNLAPATTAAMYPNFPVHSDGFKPSGTTTDEGYTLYLDDIAKFAYDIDMKTTGNDLTGASYNDPNFLKQNMVTYTVGFAVANQMLSDAATDSTGFYYQANNEAQLTAALQGALTDIQERTASAAAVSSNSTRLTSDTLIFQARFSNTDWSGQLLAYPIGANGEIGVLDDNDVPQLPGRSGWNAANVMPAWSARKIFTINPSTNVGMNFQWASLTSSQQSDLNKNTAGSNDGNGSKRLDYIRGDQSNEAPAAAGFRKRSTILGDITNSDPTYVSQQDYGFDLLPGAEGSSYKAFRKSTVFTTRPPMIYAAANDGMLHGFNALTGVELFAFVPGAVYPELTFWTHPTFNSQHRLINDGSPKAMAAYLGGAWKTVLLGSLGGGGRGIYALDVTDPVNFSASKVMWEFTSSNDNNLGSVMPGATIARMYDGNWAAIVPNGYNSNGTKAQLLILNLQTGALIKRIDTGAGSDNGLSGATPVDVDGDRITDYIYAGDLQGNMWKFDVTSSSSSNWKVDFGGAPLYTACSADPCTTSNRQPITARPEVGINPAAGYFVYFGTGRYFAVGDNSVSSGVNTFYAIRDKNTKGTASPVAPAAGKSTLLQQTVLSEQVRNYGLYQEGIRITSNNAITDDKDGWYLNLPTTGERQVSSPLLRSGRLIFTTVIPNGDYCSAGGDSWLMEVDALSGSRLTESPFDLNRDRSFDVNDFAPLNPNDPNSPLVPVSGRKSVEGIIKAPGIVSDDRIEYKFASGSAGGIDTTVENAGKQRGRQSWREIQ